MTCHTVITERVVTERREPDMAPIIWLTLAAVVLLYIVLGIWAVARIFPARREVEVEAQDAHQPPPLPGGNIRYSGNGDSESRRRAVMW